MALRTLEEQQDDTARTNRRVEIFNEWAVSPTEELVGILERSDFREPMDASHGSSFIIRLIYRFRWRELTDPQLYRLDTVARTPTPDRLEQSVRSDALE